MVPSAGEQLSTAVFIAQCCVLTAGSFAELPKSPSAHFEKQKYFKKRKSKQRYWNYKLVRLTSASKKTMEKILLENMLRHMKNKEVAGGSQHGFTKCKWYL